MKLGVEVLLESQLELVRGKRVGLIANPASTDAALTGIVDRLRAAGVGLVALYGPEHGVRGDAQAGEYVPFHYDAGWQLPVFSLYGQTQKPPAGFLTEIDAVMRSYDTRSEGKTVPPGALRGVEVLVCDLPDVGTRVYTYAATAALAMEAAAENGIPFVVLDRPNPITGAVVEGPVVGDAARRSFIAMHPVPLRHGLTAGELARLYNACVLGGRADLTVVPMQGWTRGQWFDETGLPWVPPSPNLPTPDAAIVYPGQVLLEGTNLSEGRGTTKPFEFCGAPWLDGHVLARELNALSLPGVRFREAWFTPTFSKHAGRRCGGCQLHVRDRGEYEPVATALGILHVVSRLAGERLEYHAEYFDRMLGTSAVRTGLIRGQTGAQIAAAWREEAAAFARTREPYLLYR